MKKATPQQKVSEATLLFDTGLIEKIKEAMVNANATVAVAESVTGGFLQGALTQANSASQFFHGGITAYNLGQKARHFDINTIHAETCDCVSEIVANEMALSVARLFVSDYGISVTGYATTLPELGVDKTFAYCAIAHNNKVILSKKIRTAKSEEGLTTQLYYVNKCLELFYEVLRNSRKPITQRK